MLQSNRRIADRGSASLEFATVGILLLVPLLYLVVAVSTIQSAALAAESAARQGVRLFVLSQSAQEGRDALEQAIAFSLADHGLDSVAATATIRCTPDPDDCLRPSSIVAVEVTLAVPLPLMPPALQIDAPATVPVVASSVQQVSRFRVGG